ncbi:hypothetical protein [Streptomyces sp. NPDC093591]|uniref:hypothetical protein n=1 Tax=Streptomyces sp. NPDC093591 TaxID=3366044 RepID=UPI0037F62AEE
MTGPSSTPRPERSPRPGVTWETRLVRTEVVVDDPDDTTVPGMNEPVPPRPNRATRRAAARAARRTK